MNQSFRFSKEGTVSPFGLLPARGVYTLVIFLSQDVSLNVGRLGFQSFPRGHYSYTGSALGVGATSLSHRILRHLRKEKRNFWHIDFLLAQKDAVVMSVVAAPTTNRKMECHINSHIKEKCQAKVPVPGFGASDCGKNCGSHLLYFGKRVTEKKIATLYAEMGYKPITIQLEPHTSHLHLHLPLFLRLCVEMKSLWCIQKEIRDQEKGSRNEQTVLVICLSLKQFSRFLGFFLRLLE